MEPVLSEEFIQVAASQPKLAGIDPVEQVELPGLAAVDGGSKGPKGERQLPLMAAVPDERPEWPPHPDQLQFGRTQLPLVEQPPAPQQLSLLPEPAVWEEPSSPPAPRPQGRLNRRRSRAGIGPGQTALFP